jgi:predicted phosphodiesterase
VNVALIADVHGNLQALEAVLDDAADRGCDQLWCLGDIVDYGADPEACVELVRSQASTCLAGNHDMAVTGALSLERFSDVAVAAARYSQRVLSAGSITYLRTLEPSQTCGDLCGLYHGSPRDPVWEYLLSPLQAELSFDSTPQRLSFIGHSHVALAFHRQEGESATGETHHADEELDLATGSWLVNPGSVGQPRDGDPRAAWLELDLDALQARFHRVAYDVRGAAMAIRAAHLPTVLADRLSHGQ